MREGKVMAYLPEMVTHPSRQQTLTCLSKPSNFNCLISRSSIAWLSISAESNGKQALKLSKLSFSLVSRLAVWKFSDVVYNSKQLEVYSS